MSAMPYIPLRQILLGLVTLTLITLPFAHRTGAAPLTAEMTDYLAMGGTMAQLCGDIGAAPTGGCESCRINDALMLAPPAPTWHAAQMSRVLRAALRNQPPSTRQGSVSPPARAPPLV